MTKKNILAFIITYVTSYLFSYYIMLKNNIALKTFIDNSRKVSELSIFSFNIFIILLTIIFVLLLYITMYFIIYSLSSIFFKDEIKKYSTNLSVSILLSASLSNLFIIILIDIFHLDYNLIFLIGPIIELLIFSGLFYNKNLTKKLYIYVIFIKLVLLLTNYIVSPIIFIN